MRPWRFATDNIDLESVMSSAVIASMRPWRFATDNPPGANTAPIMSPCFNEAVAFCHG